MRTGGDKSLALLSEPAWAEQHTELGMWISLSSEPQHTHSTARWRGEITNTKHLLWFLLFWTLLCLLKYPRVSPDERAGAQSTWGNDSEPAQGRNHHYVNCGCNRPGLQRGTRNENSSATTQELGTLPAAWPCHPSPIRALRLGLRWGFNVPPWFWSLQLHPSHSG